jgi:Capsule polysaccharide biosynthesis protein
MSRTALVLISEARGEFLAIERMRAGLHARGFETLHITPLGSDVTPNEVAESAANVLDRQAEYLDAMTLDGPRLAEAIDQEQRLLDVNLRRLWRADIRSWREGFTDEQMARITVGYVRALRRILLDVEPLALWAEDGGHLCKQLAFLLCSPLGIEHLVYWAFPLPRRMVLCVDSLARIDRASIEDFDPTPEEVGYAEGFLAGVRGSEIHFTVPRDIEMNSGRIVNFGRLLTQRYVTRPAGAESLYPLRFARMYARQRANALRVRRLYRPFGDRPFVFYPLHSTRDTQISIRAHQWENQLALVGHVAASLPFGFDLVIKEHPYEVGAYSSSDFGRLLHRYPLIRLIDPGIHSHALFPRCAAIATINSTAGFEGLFFGKPVITFGHSPYRGLGLSYDVTDLYETPQIVLDALEHGAASDEAVVRFIAFLYRNSVPGVSLSYDLGDENIGWHVDYFTRCLADTSARAGL